jgi:hypothetical protein
MIAPTKGNQGMEVVRSGAREVRIGIRVKNCNAPNITYPRSLVAEPFTKSGDLGDAGTSHCDQRNRRHRPAALTESHIEIQ